ncbi:SDR family oxidoreductase [Thalassobius sp. MITS945101]|uniref:SDR family oxidoreductase n=1 Tax=Thalassobius sp. MITS945101 TaxID=3096994 RepID=UPI00399AEFD5
MPTITPTKPIPLRICIAGATGYLGRHLVREAHKRSHQVTALVRAASKARFPDGVTIVQGEATQPETLAPLQAALAGTDVMISALGLTRQKDKLRYKDVDFQANMNLLDLAQAAGVPRFAYVHALVRGKPKSDLLAAKSQFVQALRAAQIESHIFRPGGYFVDMEAVLDMARSGRIWAVGDGSVRLNPIEGADLAQTILDALERGENDLEIGGPEVLSLDEIGALAFAALGQPVRITHLPRGLAVALLALLKPLTPRHIWGPFEFFLAASAQDAIGPAYGAKTLGAHFKALAAKPEAK